MGRRPLIQERKHPLYFKMAPLREPVEQTGVRAVEASGAPPEKGPEFFMEQVMEGLSDACLLVDGGDRILYVNLGQDGTMFDPFTITLN